VITDKLNSLSAVTLNGFKFRVIDLCDHLILVLDHPLSKLHVDVSISVDDSFERIAQSCVPPMVEALIKAIDRRSRLAA
jgi:hypothetical protein